MERIRHAFQKARLRNKRKGSDTMEMVVHTAFYMVLILMIFLILIYMVEYCLVNFATNACARDIETTGVIPANLETKFKDILGTTEFLPRTERHISVSPRKTRYQLKDTFSVTGEAVYRIHIIKPGLFEGFYVSLPIRVRVTGMSEVYF